MANPEKRVLFRKRARNQEIPGECRYRGTTFAARAERGLDVDPFVTSSGQQYGEWWETQNSPPNRVLYWAMTLGAVAAVAVFLSWALWSDSSNLSLAHIHPFLSSLTTIVVGLAIIATVRWLFERRRSRSFVSRPRVFFGMAVSTVVLVLLVLYASTLG